MKGLTTQQRLVLETIEDWLVQYGYPPTRSEIAYEMGWKSVNSANATVSALAKKGYVRVTPGVARGIKVLEKSRKNV